jgi:hypothetical protein
VTLSSNSQSRAARPLWSGKSRAFLLASSLFASACGKDERLAASAAPICDVLGEACAAAPREGPAHSPPIQVVPGQGFPSEIVFQTSHNNLDVTWHRGRLYFAFRVAPFHFASPAAMLYVVSTTDQLSWRYEATFDLDTDLREPRFLSVGGRLFVYFAVLGKNVLAFEPQGAQVSEQLAPGRWSEPEPIFEPGFIPWRTRNIDGRGYLIGYVGGESIYQNDERELSVHWLLTDDGRTFEPVVPGRPVVLVGGGSETDFAFTGDGGLVAVSRNEAGDESGWGSKICRAGPAALGDWECVSDPKKYDSPLLLNHGGELWLIGRRNLSETGDYDLFQRDLPAAEQATAYQIDYWKRPKRCALWKLDPAARKLAFVLDLPSRGDTCFASVVPLEGSSYLLYNYTSPLDGPDLPWVDAQQGPTLIHWMTLTL